MPSQPFDWQEFLTLAQNLVAIIKTEASYRVATSRSYYAAYWRARHLLEEGGANFPQKRSHEFCWKSFGNIQNSDGEKIREMGFALRDRRVEADYFDTPAMTERNAQNDVANAADLIHDLNNMTDAEKQNAIQYANYLYPSYL